MSENERNFISLDVIENLLGKDRIEVLAEEALKSNLQWYLRDKRNLDNLIYDTAKKFALEYIAMECGTEMHEECAKAIRDTLDKEGSIAFYMFTDNQEGMKILNEEIRNERPYLKARIRDAMDQLVFKMDGQDIMEYIWEAVIYKLFEEKAKDEAHNINEEKYLRAGE